jgi:hypothetical protein
LRPDTDIINQQEGSIKKTECRRRSGYSDCRNNEKAENPQTDELEQQKIRSFEGDHFLNNLPLIIAGWSPPG